MEPRILPDANPAELSSPDHKRFPRSSTIMHWLWQN